VIAWLAALALAAPGHAAPPPATAVGVGLREWRVSVFRPRVPAGRVRLNLTNFGEDAHNLVVVGPRGGRSRVSADVAPGGGRLALAVTLRRRGVYRLLCVKPGHLARGMRATLRVTRRRSHSGA
jgi:hypothetical protein